MASQWHAALFRASRLRTALKQQGRVEMPEKKTRELTDRFLSQFDEAPVELKRRATYAASEVDWASGASREKLREDIRDWLKQHIAFCADKEADLKAQVGV